MAIVWPCSLSVEEYVAAGRDLAVPRPDCPTCWAPMGFWSGYWRSIWEAGEDLKMFVRRARCGFCQATHALLPAFCLTNRLHSAEVIGEAIETVALSPSGVRPVAAHLDVPYTTARGWVRRFSARAKELASAFAGLAAELGGQIVRPAHDLLAWAARAILAAFDAAHARPGWAAITAWRFVSTVTGGRAIATNRNSPYLVVGRRYFMAPVPST